MIAAVALLSELSSLGVRLTIVEGELRATPAARVPRAMLPQLRAHRDELIAHLRAEHAAMICSVLATFGGGTAIVDEADWQRVVAAARRRFPNGPDDRLEWIGRALSAVLGDGSDEQRARARYCWTRYEQVADDWRARAEAS